MTIFEYRFDKYATLLHRVFRQKNSVKTAPKMKEARLLYLKAGPSYRAISAASC